jgi:hypothetical protein
METAKKKKKKKVDNLTKTEKLIALYINNMLLKITSTKFRLPR